MRKLPIFVELKLEERAKRDVFKPHSKRDVKPLLA